MIIQLDHPYFSEGKKRKHQLDLIWKHSKRRLKRAGKPFRPYEILPRMMNLIDKTLRKLHQTGYKMITWDEAREDGYRTWQIRGFVLSHHAVWVCRRKR